MTDEQENRYSVSLVIRETKKSHHELSVHHQNGQHLKDGNEGTEKSEPFCTVGGKQCGSFLHYKKMELQYGLAIPLLGTHPKYLQVGSRRDICISMFIVVF